MVFTACDQSYPKISLVSIENKIYDKSNIPLDFTVNKATSRISYVLDGQSNVTINGNTTLSDLSNGLHNITVYAWDLAGNVGSSETVALTVAEPESSPIVPFTVAKPKPFSIVLVVASIATVAMVSIGLLVYFKKRHREAEQA